MSNPQQAVQKAPLSLAQCVNSDTWKTEIQKVIPKELVIDAFLRVTRTVASERKFAECDQRSFLSALLKCARAGLAPDGIHAHLIPFGKEVTCIFDWKGVVDLAARNSIEVIPKVICEFDKFSVEEDDGTGKTVVHHSWGQENRGTITGYYSRARRKDGSVDYEFMSRDEVEETRKNYSNARNSKAWQNSFDEMAKKTVIKRHSKRWPISQEIRAAIQSDDDGITDTPALTVAKPIFESAPPAIKVLKQPKPEPEQDNPPKFEEEPPEGEAPQPDAPEPEPRARHKQKEEPDDDPPPAPPDEADGGRPLKQLRHLLKAGGIKEGELIDWFGTTGAIDGSQSTLEEIFVTNQQVILSTVFDFQRIALKIKALRSTAKP